MRDYAQLMPAFYVKGSGARLRGNPHALALGPYLFAAPLSNMIGLYHIRLSQIADDLGFSVEDVSLALSAVVKAGIAEYDREAELLFLPEGARVQMNLRLNQPIKANDKRMRRVENMLDLVAGHRFETAFRQRYLPHTVEEQNNTVSPIPNSCDGASGLGKSPHVPTPTPVPDPVPAGGSGGPTPVLDGAVDPWALELAEGIRARPDLHNVIVDAVAVAVDVRTAACNRRGGDGLKPKHPAAWSVAALDRVVRKVRSAEQAGTPMPAADVIDLLKLWASNPKDPKVYVDEPKRPRPKIEPVEELTPAERAANAARAHEHGPMLRAALGKIGTGGAA
jgi:hypothetical protein